MSPFLTPGAASERLVSFLKNCEGEEGEHTPLLHEAVGLLLKKNKLKAGYTGGS
jgi:hypothetical protein